MHRPRGQSYHERRRLRDPSHWTRPVRTVHRHTSSLAVRPPRHAPGRMRHAPSGFRRGRREYACSCVSNSSRFFCFFRLAIWKRTATHQGDPPHLKAGPCDFLSIFLQFSMCHELYTSSRVSRSGFLGRTRAIIAASKTRLQTSVSHLPKHRNLKMQFIP
jgi:hypothetical protein